jgi:translocator protein
MTRFFLFLLINFAALGIGSWIMGNPSTNEWYNAQEKAPWTPPGWVFGAAWFSIMFCFAIFMYYVSSKYPVASYKYVYVLFALQFVLNVIWNPVFFNWQMVAPGLIIILLLTALMIWFLIWGKSHIGWNTLWVLPYCIWLIIASSLNAYVLLKN